MKPRNQEELDAHAALDLCPPWWQCEKRGCYQTAKEMYGDPKMSVRSGDPLQADYSVCHDGIRYCGEMAYPNKEQK